MRVFK
jgi:chromate transport protein ChrA